MNKTNPLSPNAKTVGIIAEYNPFHKGHKYHIEKAKEITGAKYCVVVMSGNFVQRGEPSIIDKYSRAECALKAGADLVIELPTIFATASAEGFAYGAISLLNNLGIIDSICFGAECENISLLNKLADLLLLEPSEYIDELKSELKNGKSYPAARNTALVKYFDECDETKISTEELTQCLYKPNNILGIEYIKAIKKSKSSIQPFIIKRKGNEYNDITLPDADENTGETDFSSAMAIRQALSTQEVQTNLLNLTAIEGFLPEEMTQILKKEKASLRFPILSNDISGLLYYKLLSYESQGYSMFADISEDLSDRIQNKLKDYSDFNSFCEILKTKNLTYSRISRCLLHILLDIKKADLIQTEVCYANVLGFRKSAQLLLTAIKQKDQIPLITKTSSAKDILKAEAYKAFMLDIKASQIYEALILDKFKNYKDSKKNPLIQSPIIL